LEDGIIPEEYLGEEDWLRKLRKMKKEESTGSKDADKEAKQQPREKGAAKNASLDEYL